MSVAAPKTTAPAERAAVADDPHIHIQAEPMPDGLPVADRDAPVGFSAMQPDYRPAPAIGADSEEVLGELLGYSRDEIARLRDDKILV